jgi:predicted MFS family arabinose efflux permease
VRPGASSKTIESIRGGAMAAREDVRTTIRALSSGGQLRRLLLAEGQSALGDAAAEVALLLIAYERLRSPWALSAVLLADRVPRMVLAPLAGVLADRMSRRVLLIVADLLRASALLGLVLIPSFAVTVLLAGVLGCGTALYRPTVEASLPALAHGRQGAAATVTSRWTMITLGEMLGLALAAAMLLAFSPEGVLLLDAATFAVSIAVLWRTTTLNRQAEPAPEREASEGALRMLREGAGATRQIPGMLVLFVTVLSAILAGGLMNVGDPLLARNVLHAGNSGFAAVKVAIGVGLVLGTILSGPRGNPVGSMRSSYFRALGMAATGIAIMAASPDLPIALLGCLILGAGNGLAVARHLQLIQLTTPEWLIGRVNGLLNAAEAAAFLVAFVVAVPAVALLGVRETFAISAVGVFVAAGVGYIRMRRIKDGDAPPALTDSPLQTSALAPVDRVSSG